MSEFKVTLARIEAVDEGEQGEQIRAVFHIERDLIGFNVPIYLRARDFDNSEMVRAARNSLHWMFVELANQTKGVRAQREKLRSGNSVGAPAVPRARAGSAPVQQRAAIGVCR